MYARLYFLGTTFEHSTFAVVHEMKTLSPFFNVFFIKRHKLIRFISFATHIMEREMFFVIL